MMRERRSRTAGVLAVAVTTWLAAGTIIDSIPQQQRMQTLEQPAADAQSFRKQEHILFPVKQPPLSLLILGVDSRHGESARADSVMLAVLDPNARTARILPIPRDTYVNVPEHGFTKINHAMAYGGSRLMKQTVESWLQVPVDHTLVLDFRGFRKLVDLLGGIRVDAEKSMHYSDPTDGTEIHIKQGVQIMNGKQALDYVRFRNDREADTGRMRRQQQVLRAIIDKGISINTLPRVFQILDILGDHVKTTLPPGEIFLLSGAYYRIEPESIRSEEVNGINRVAPVDGLWYFFVEKAEQERVHQLLSGWLRRN